MCQTTPPEEYELAVYSVVVNDLGNDSDVTRLRARLEEDNYNES